MPPDRSATRCRRCRGPGAAAGASRSPRDGSTCVPGASASSVTLHFPPRPAGFAATENRFLPIRHADWCRCGPESMGTSGTQISNLVAVGSTGGGAGQRKNPGRVLVALRRWSWRCLGLGSDQPAPLISWKTMVPAGRVEPAREPKARAWLATIRHAGGRGVAARRAVLMHICTCLHLGLSQPHSEVRRLRPRNEPFRQPFRAAPAGNRFRWPRRVCL